MGRLCFGARAAAIAASFLLLILPGCGGSKPKGGSPFAAKITLTPATSYSMQEGSVIQLTASAENSSNTALNTTFVYQSSNPAVVDVAPNGTACAGSWNAPTYSICTPNATGGTSEVTASALGGTSAPTLFFVHGPIDAIQVSVVPPVNSLPPACPNQVALPIACNLAFNAAASNFCLSQNQIQTLQATAYSQGNDITTTVGPFTWSQVASGVATVTPIVTSTQYNLPTNQATVVPGTPGQTQVVASAAGVFSQPYYVETCPIQCITLQVGTESTGASSFSVNKGTSETLTATAVDVQGCVVPKPPLTWISTNPAALTAGSTTTPCAAGTTCAITTAQPGTGTITASCSPPTCNVGFPFNPAGLAAPYIPQPVYPVNAISGLVTGAINPTKVFTTSRDCSSNQLCSVGLYSVSTSTNLPGTAFQLPSQPNSLMFDPGGDKAYMGSQFGALLINAANLGSTTTPFTALPAANTPLGLVTGNVIAVSTTGNAAIFSDTVSTPNKVYIVTVASSTTSSGTTSSAASVSFNINGATTAAFSPDGLKAFILANGGTTLYMYSALQSLSAPITLPTPATAVVFSSTGSFALLSGGGTPGNLAAYNTCDNSPITPALAAGAIPSPPLFLKMVPAANVAMGSTFGNLIIPQLQTMGLDFFFGLDNTGIDIIATNTSFVPLPLPAGQLSSSTLCPLPVVLGQTAATPATAFTPVHINIGDGTFTPIAFFLSPDTSMAYIVTTDLGVLIYDFNTNTFHQIPLVNDAVPVAADVTVDGTLIYVAGSDGLLHAVSTQLDLDEYQVLFPALPNSSSSFCYTADNCGLDVMAVQP